MIDLTKFPILNKNYEYLIDNHEQDAYLQTSNPQDYLIVYSYIHDIIETTIELIKYNIEFTHCQDPYSDETYLLINIKQ